MENPDGAGLLAENPDDVAAGPAKLSLQRLHALHRGSKVLLKQLSEDVHDDSDITPDARRRNAHVIHKDRWKIGKGRSWWISPGIFVIVFSL